jgi:hypothetical protein
MPILNYTTGIEASRSIAEIQDCLVKHGAASVLSEFDNNGFIVAVSFRIRVNEQMFDFRLPSDWHPVLALLEQTKKVPRRLVTQDQALKVSWRILKDWVEAQMALVEIKMVKTQQVFLPYLVGADDKTLYERFEKNPQLLLGND